MPAGDNLGGAIKMPDRFDVKNSKGDVVGSIEKKPDYSGYSSETELSEQIMVWSIGIGAVIGALYNGRNGYHDAVGVGYFVLYLLWGAFLGGLVGLLVHMPIAFAANLIRSVFKNPLQYIILLSILGGIAFLWLNRDLKFH
jgi:hypothetical protein